VDDCLPDEILERLGSDATDAAHFLTIEDQVEGCPKCRESLERLVSCRSRS
jgi:hypothetical protein